MAKKKAGLPFPDELIIEVVHWEDAEGSLSSKFTTDLPVQVSIGASIFENEKLLILATTFIHGDAWLDDQVDFVKVPKSLIVRRETVGIHKTDG